MQNVTHTSTRGLFSITQCTSFNDESGECDTSTLRISDLHLRDHHSSTRATEVAELQCSEAAGGCSGVGIAGVDVLVGKTGEVVGGYNCSGVVEPTVGFSCDE